MPTQITETLAGSVTPGTGRSSAQLASVKIVVVAPIPSASVEDRDGREAGAAAELPQRVAEVLPKIRKHAGPPFLVAVAAVDQPARLRDVFTSAEFPRRGGRRLFGRQPLRGVLGAPLLEVRRDLLVDVAIDVRWPGFHDYIARSVSVTSTRVAARAGLHRREDREGDQREHGQRPPDGIQRVDADQARAQDLGERVASGKTEHEARPHDGRGSTQHEPEHFRVRCAERQPDAELAPALRHAKCLSGIPGLVGATPIQNVGAYGQEVSETIVAVRALDTESGEVARLSPADCRFTYRDSAFKSGEPGRWVVLSVSYRLRPGSRPTVRYAEVEQHLANRGIASPSLGQVRESVLAIRRTKSMVLEPGDPNRRSCGSFFVNPVVAGKRPLDWPHSGRPRPCRPGPSPTAA